MFALMLQGSQASSRKKFEEVIACVWNVREAWRQIAQNPVVQEVAQPLADPPSQLADTKPSQSAPPSRWTV
jgi:flagellar protein FliS